jgi:hypothetical protein
MKSLKHFRPFVAGTINERNSLEQYYIYVIFVNIFVKEKANHNDWLEGIAAGLPGDAVQPYVRLVSPQGTAILDRQTCQ